MEVLLNIFAFFIVVLLTMYITNTTTMISLQQADIEALERDIDQMKQSVVELRYCMIRTEFSLL